MVKKRKSDKRVAKEREDGHKRIEEKIIKKEDKNLEEGMIARDEALKAAGIKQEYNYADHQHIYNYANDRDGALPSKLSDIKSLNANCALILKMATLDANEIGG